MSEEIAGRQVPRCVVLPATDDAAGVLQRTGILALPSLVEGFPLSLLEAMACGVPAVAADASAGVRELVDDGRTGLLTVRGDADDLAAALDRLMGDGELRRDLAAHARSHARAYRLDGILDQWEQLLASL
jgi:glycosyltransferase involved in cell wall biosynthesis